MAKTIKFNLICDGNPVRTLDDLRNNFSAEDVLKYYENKLLHRWLDVRGYDNELKKVEEITPTDELSIVKALITIFEVETDPSIMEKNLYILQYRKKQEALLDTYEKQEYKVQEILNGYHDGYCQLVREIIKNKDNISRIKAAIREINYSYSKLYELDCRNLFYILKEDAPMAVFVLLMNENMRKQYLPLEVAKEDGSVYLDTSTDVDKDYMYKEITEMVAGKNISELRSILGENLKVFSGVTDGYWKDIEPKGKKYMILDMIQGDFVRNAGAPGEENGYSAVSGKFIIFDGIDYKSNNANHKLLYMEV